MVLLLSSVVLLMVLLLLMMLDINDNIYFQRLVLGGCASNFIKFKCLPVVGGDGAVDALPPELAVGPWLR